jgi:hypothetical protein
MSSNKGEVTIKQTTITSQALGGSSTDTMVLYAPFLNLFGIFMTLALCITFLLLSGMTIKFMKVFSFKIRIIIDKAQNSDNKERRSPQTSRINEYEKSVTEKIEELERPSFRTMYKQLSWKYNFFSFYYPLYRAKWNL